MDKTICAGGADGPFVEVHGIERAAFGAGDLRADQRGAVLEVRRTIRCPFFEPTMVRGQRLEMLLPLFGLGRIEGRGSGKSAVKLIFGFFKGAE